MTFVRKVPCAHEIKTALGFFFTGDQSSLFLCAARARDNADKTGEHGLSFVANVRKLPQCKSIYDALGLVDRVSQFLRRSSFRRSGGIVGSLPAISALSGDELEAHRARRKDR
jgi:hypothetical protein